MLRKLAAGTGAALVAAGLAAAPAVASRLPAAPDESCGDVPHAEQNGLVKATTPPAGSTVAPGDAIDVALQWSGDVLDATVLDRALDCVEIDGRPAPGLSLDEPGVPNHSPVLHRYRIPSGLAPGAEVCDQGFLFGPPADVPQRLASNRVCFTVATPGPPTTRPTAPAGGGPHAATPPTTEAGGPPEAPGPGLPPSGGSGPGGPGSPGPGLPPGGGGRVPSGDTSATVPPPLSQPPPAPPSSPAASARPAEGVRAPGGAPEDITPDLPRTGREDRPLTVAGGVNLIAAGLALIAGARHRRRRPAPPPPAPPA